MTIDAFTFVGESLLGYSQSEAELLARLDAADVAQAIICPLKPPAYHLETANDLVAEACRRQPRLIGFARVDPHQGDRAVHELERGLHDLGATRLVSAPVGGDVSHQPARSSTRYSGCVRRTRPRCSSPVTRGSPRRRRSATWRGVIRTSPWS